MDLGAYMRVAWRFKTLLAGGLVLATFVAFLSLAKVEFEGAKPTFRYRENPVWVSASTVFVTQDGFPWGRAILDEMIRVENEGAEPTYVPRFGDPGRYSGLAALYAELAKSDEVQREVLKSAPPGARYEPDIVSSPDSGVLPLIYMTGYGPSPEAAKTIANRATDAFREYLADKQAASNISPSKRVEVVVIKRATAADVYTGRSLVRPIFLFLLILLVFVALAFALENIRPRTRVAADVRPAEQPPAPARRSA